MKKRNGISFCVEFSKTVEESDLEQLKTIYEKKALDAFHKMFKTYDKKCKAWIKIY